MPARATQSSNGRDMGEAVMGTGMPAKRRLLYMHTVYCDACVWLVTEVRCRGRTMAILGMCSHPVIDFLDPSKTWIKVFRFV